MGSDAVTRGAPAWHALPLDECARRLDVDLRAGLTDAEAQARLRRAGPNSLPAPQRVPPWQLLLAQFSDVMTLALIVAAVVAMVVGDVGDSGAIFAILLLNGALGFTQDMRASRALEALRDLAVPHSHVRRDGRGTLLSADLLVPGDLVLLEAGDIVPADVRLVEAVALRASEASLTGESVPVDKLATTVDGAAVLADRRNIAYQGTYIVHGRGSAVVIATGRQTELGRVVTMLAAPARLVTPLQRRLAGLGRSLTALAALLGTAVFVIGVSHGVAPAALLLTIVSLAVAAIPEAMPAVLTVALARGAHRMARRHALVRRLPAVESLGAVTVICTDKTGTLTENRLAVACFCLPGDVPRAVEVMRSAPVQEWLALAECAVLVNDALVEGAGDPLEVALVEGAQQLGVDVSGVRARWPRVAEAPFSGERARMVTLHEGEGRAWRVAVKGAPERVLPRCRTARGREGIAHGDATAVLEQSMADAARLARDGLRVMALAQRTGTPPAGADLELLEHDLEFLGLVAFADPPRREAAEAVTECRRAGIRVLMVTGDHPETAAAIARATGIAEQPLAWGSQIDALSDADLLVRFRGGGVLARVTPEQKLRLVRVLRAGGEVVAMTGDGVNDAPALRYADIGVAMGRSGTEVARDAASLVLLDDHFGTIVAAVREGRRIHDNVRRFLSYALAGNVAELLTVVALPLLGAPLPLLPLHILWINLVTDGLPGLSLTAEPAERNVMQRAPDTGAAGLLRGHWRRVWLAASLMTITNVMILQVHRDLPLPEWRTLAFTTLALGQLFYVWSLRARAARPRAWWRRPLALTVLGTIAGQLAVPFIPAVARSFHVAPLRLPVLASALLAAVLPAVIVEGVRRAEYNRLEQSRTE